MRTPSLPILSLCLALSLALASPSLAASFKSASHRTTSSTTALSTLLAPTPTLSAPSRQVQVPQLEQPVATRSARLGRLSETTCGGDGEVRDKQDAAVEKRWEGEQAIRFHEERLRRGSLAAAASPSQGRVLTLLLPHRLADVDLDGLGDQVRGSLPSNVALRRYVRLIDAFRLSSTQDVPTEITIYTTYGKPPIVDGGTIVETIWKGQSTLTVPGPSYLTLVRLTCRRSMFAVLTLLDHADLLSDRYDILHLAHDDSYVDSHKHRLTRRRVCSNVDGVRARRRG